MIKNSIRVFLLLSSIVAAFILPKKSFTKYLPVTLFSSSVLLAEMFYLTIHKLWKAKGSPGVMICNTFVLVLGPYFFANLWVFHLSKGRFLLYSFINIIADLIYAFPIISLFKKVGFFKLKIKSSVFFLIIISNAFLNYIFQTFYEKLNAKFKTDNSQYELQE
ncbi:hypothetical protein [Heyndrickxia vini]|uniref:Uncharacterized protein n=1 Tax=Heyndrickxia vini TaxID=1476025 RepID=A0ABX7E3S5_9BACI|nr:hypothetical protein [Heyndrickxia vini]QQZ09896.1 hypothetical protein I5776_02670 [Heyndrickxia vini]